MVGSRKHLSLVFHSLKPTAEDPSPFSDELFSSIDEIEELVQALKSEGYKFDLFKNLTEASDPTCSITFDDGYYNNHLFLPLAHKYKIPFVIFISAYNITKSQFFLWDIMSSEKVETWDWKDSSYLKSYEAGFPKVLLDKKWTDLYRPFTFEELRVLSSNSLVFFGNHTYSHKPLSAKYDDDLEQELSACNELCKGFPNFLSDELALPCGLLAYRHKRYLKKHFRRIYTSEGKLNFSDDLYIGRVSMINPKIGGSFMSQIEKAQNPIRLMKRNLQRFILSNF